MKKCIIIDDETNCRIALKEIIKLSNCALEVIYETGNALEAYELLISNVIKPDIVFLDIQMPGCDGFSFLKKFDFIPFQVIFSTAYDQQAINSLYFSDLDYLLKPIDVEDLKNLLLKLNQNTNNLNNQLINHFKLCLINKTIFEKLIVIQDNVAVIININEIVCIESKKEKVLIHLLDDSIISSDKSIDFYEEILVKHPFCRVDNSYFINYKRINVFDSNKTNYVEMENGLQFSVSARKKEELLKLISNNK